MKHTSRKKMLLSSIAMLLVALVALGSATYAWFTIDKTVTANGMVVKAVATAGLEISNKADNSGFANTVSYGQTTTDGQNFTLKPVSWNGTATDAFIPNGNITDSSAGTYSGAFKAVGNDDKPSAVTIASGDVAKSGSNGYFAQYNMWVRSAAEGSTRVAHTVQAKVEIAGDNADFARVKFLDGSTSKGIFGDEGSTENVVVTAGSDKTTYTVTADASDFNVTGTDGTAVGKPFSIIVWFDGEDSACVNNAKNACANITVSFTATDM